MEGVVVIVFMMTCLLLPSFFSCVAALLLRLTETKVKTKKQIEYVYINKFTPRRLYPEVQIQEYNPPIKSKTRPVTIATKQTVLPTPKRVEKANANSDYVECLVALGMKKTEAKKKVEQMFLNKNYCTVEDFIMDVYKK
jgi:hypothetical protein